MLTDAVLEAQNRRLREENEELRETVRQLRERSSAAEPEALPSGLPYLTNSEEIVLRCILGARDIATYERIYEALYRHDEDRDSNIIKVLVSRLRKKVGHVITIETMWGRGYKAALISEAVAA